MFDGIRAGPSRALLVGLFFVTLWLGVPVAALANDCPSVEELGDCLKQAFGPLGALGLLGAALGGFGLLIGAGSGGPSVPEPPRPPKPTPPPNPSPTPRQDPSYDPGGFNSRT